MTASRPTYRPRESKIRFRKKGKKNLDGLSEAVSKGLSMSQVAADPDWMVDTALERTEAIKNEHIPYVTKTIVESDQPTSLG